MVWSMDWKTADSVATGRKKGVPLHLFEDFGLGGGGRARLSCDSGSRGASRCNSRRSTCGGATIFGATSRDRVGAAGTAAVAALSGASGAAGVAG